MAANLNGSFQSCIGKGTKVSGKLNFREPARIEGEAEGEITGEEITIAPGAVVTARIAAVRLTIAGQVSGEIIARERIELLPTARLRCTISTPSLVLNEGAQFDGDCKMPREHTVTAISPA
jgi:cytoskeletal protein CcmA (bactofilin family)